MECFLSHLGWWFSYVQEILAVQVCYSCVRFNGCPVLGSQLTYCSVYSQCFSLKFSGIELDWHIYFRICWFWKMFPYWFGGNVIFNTWKHPCLSSLFTVLLPPLTICSALVLLCIYVLRHWLFSKNSFIEKVHLFFLFAFNFLRLELACSLWHGWYDGGLVWVCTMA